MSGRAHGGTGEAIMGFIALAGILAILILPHLAPARGVTPSSGDIAVLASMGQQIITQRLNDPDSATFRNVRVNAPNGKAVVVCGEVNWKNELGGLTGYTRFIVAPSNSSLAYLESDVEDFSGLWGAVCFSPLRT